MIASAFMCTKIYLVVHAKRQGRTVVLARCEGGRDHEGGDVSSTCGRVATVALSLLAQE